nr:MAG TPA: hypothetical protein [Caudoviricetes sp.]
MNKDIEKQEERVRLTIPLLTQEETNGININMNEIIEQFTKMVIKDKDLAIAQHIIKMQQEKIEKLEQENNKQKEELEMYKDFKEIANTKIGDANPLRVLEVNKILDRQCKRQQIILNKVTEECRKQMTEYEDSILEIFP